MILSGSTVIVSLNMGIHIDQIFLYGSIITGFIAFVTLSSSSRVLRLLVKSRTVNVGS